MNKWISVKDKVPTNDYNILLWKTCLEIGFYSPGSGCFYCSRRGSCLDSVTHWMPLPDAPKDES